MHHTETIFGNGEQYSSHLCTQSTVLAVYGHTGWVNTQNIGIPIKQPLASPARFETCTQSQH